MTNSRKVNIHFMTNSRKVYIDLVFSYIYFCNVVTKFEQLLGKSGKVALCKSKIGSRLKQKKLLIKTVMVKPPKTSISVFNSTNKFIL